MKLLLDTHAFLWWGMDRAKLSEKALNACEDQQNTLLFSVVSIWELQIKLQLGKIKFAKPLRNLIEDEQETNSITLLDETPEHIWALEPLPLHHRDPFDRLLIAQAIADGAILITTDARFTSYPVLTLW